MWLFLSIVVTMAVGFGLFFGILFAKTTRESLNLSAGLAILSLVGFLSAIQYPLLPFLDSMGNWFVVFTRGFFLLVGSGSAFLSLRDLRRGIERGL